MAWRTRINRSIGRAFIAVGLEPPRRRGQGNHADAYEDQVSLLGPRGASLILDVGANAGETASRYRSLFPGAVVHSFEPTPDSFAALERVAASDPMIRPHRLAVADRAGALRFHLNRSSVTNSLLRPGSDACDYVDPSLIAESGETEVEATTLDAFCEAEGIDGVDILKIDVQGAEMLALQGAGRLLASGEVSLIYSEINFAPCYEGQADAGEVIRYLADLGYPLYYIYNQLPGSNGLLVQADALWVGPKLRESLRRRPARPSGAARA